MTATARENERQNMPARPRVASVPSWCAFDGSNGHDPSPKDPGQSMTWNPAEAWKFFTQF